MGADSFETGTRIVRERTSFETKTLKHLEPKPELLFNNKLLTRTQYTGPSKIASYVLTQRLVSVLEQTTIYGTDAKKYKT